ncbi:glycosyltransferase [Asanoa sp. WMMD1127]|uniref:glycosyltransferase n=1 Tax=Asanoa sp. WMMD1127 TaxID=3016107 RepID=UPI002416DE69|nr:glycosyltransferase [Asanoa sp. WMMD1127]MDG4823347.1 glycosyltransferase [Asanoa sp. WMMD1127]
MVSVVVAAHNEATVIERTLRHLLDGAEPGEFDVVVAANGCTDDTAAVARSVPGVRVVEVAEASKPAALNAGDAAAASFPRIYLDADIALTAAGARALAAAVTGPVIAASPRRVLDTAGRPLLVRAYFAVNGRLPAFRDALFGRGAIVLSKEARARFDQFPDLVADDLFLDALFAPGEKREVASVPSVVATPTRTPDLLRRLGRVRGGNSALRDAAAAADATLAVRPSRKASWLVDVVLPRPWLWPAGACYAALTLLAERRARRTPAGAAWARDESTR